MSESIFNILILQENIGLSEGHPIVREKVQHSEELTHIRKFEENVDFILDCINNVDVSYSTTEVCIISITKLIKMSGKSNQNSLSVQFPC